MNKSTLMMAFVQDLMDSCPGASLADVDAGPTGAFVFNTDSTYTIDITMTISVGMNLPLSCFPTGTTCAAVDAAFRDGVSGDPSVQAASCAGTGPCVCTVTEVPMQLSEEGTYSVSGSTLLTTPTGQATPDSTAYCAKGPTLTFKDSMPDPTNPVTAIIGTKS
jgi:hypothetical protein